MANVVFFSAWLEETKDKFYYAGVLDGKQQKQSLLLTKVKRKINWGRNQEVDGHI